MSYEVIIDVEGHVEVYRCKNKDKIISVLINHIAMTTGDGVEVIK